MLRVEIYYKPIYLLCRKLQVLRLFKMIYSIVNIQQLQYYLTFVSYKSVY